jgi:hypothetical protein
MSYIDYQKMLGLDTSSNEKVPHIDFNFKDGFDVYGTAYLDKDGVPRVAHIYVWKWGNFPNDELEKRLSELSGKKIKTVKTCGGNGHETHYFDPMEKI